MAARSGAAAARRAHNPKVLGSNPSSATTQDLLTRSWPAGSSFFAGQTGKRNGKLNKRKRVAIAKHRAKKKKLKLRPAGAS